MGVKSSLALEDTLHVAFIGGCKLSAEEALNECLLPADALFLIFFQAVAASQGFD